MSAMSPYLIPDGYTLAQLRRQYEMSDSKERIGLLKDLYDQDKGLPYDIELMAVEDPNVQVRQWVARHGSNLKYTSHFHRVGEVWVHEKIEPTLYERLKNDDDLLVRACLRENEHITLYHPEDEFSDSTHLERLALMRNSEMWLAERLLKKIFDHADKELGISVQEREELILAFLSNDSVLNELRDKADLSSERSDGVFISSFDKHSTETFLGDLWTLAAKWPTNKLPAPVPQLVYQHLAASDKVKSSIYQQCPESILRRAILESCGKQDLNTIKLGLKDSDEDCRSTARRKVSDFQLYELSDRVEEEAEPNKLKRLANRLKKWREENELLPALAIIVSGFVLMLATDEGNRALEKVLEFSSTTLGVAVFWVLVIFGFLYALALAARYSWFYHVLMLSLIGWFYFIADDSKNTATVLTIIYAFTVFGPRLWVAFSDELAEKLLKKIELARNKNLV